MKADWKALEQAHAGTDKFKNGYGELYASVIDELDEHFSVVELGVWEGASLGLWRDITKGIVVGIDHTHPQTRGGELPAGTALINLGQDNPELPRIIRLMLPGGVDLIIDDASHVGPYTRASFDLLWPLVKPGGWYVVEDWGVGIPGNNPFYGQFGGDSQFQLIADLIARCGRYDWREDGLRSDISDFRGRPSIMAVKKRA